MDSVTIAAVSCLIHPGNPEANLVQLEIWTKRAAGEGADLVLFNETSVMGYWMNLRLRQLAEPLDGPVVQRLSLLAQELDIIIAAGIIEEDADKEYNTHVLVGPKGLIGAHRKSSCPEGEERWFDIGSDYNVFDIGPCQVGIAICYESIHPEACQALAENGAEVILAPYMNAVTAREIAAGKRPYFIDRAKENGIWYVACDQANLDHSKPDKPLVAGAVCFVAPTGKIVATTDLDETCEHMIVHRLEAMETKQP